MGHAGLGNPFLGFRLSKRTLGNIPSRTEFPAQQSPNTLAIKRGKPLSGTFGARRESARSFERGLGLVCRPTLRPHDRLSIVGLQLHPLARLRLGNRGRRGAPRRLVRHGDRLAEMGDRLLEGGAAQRLVARLAPPFDGEIVEAGLGEMMGDDFRLGRGALGLVAQDFRGAAVQRLAAALEQALVGRVLDQRVLEAIVRLRASALGDEEVRVGEPVERGLEASGSLDLG